jgi:hypothetical protein
MARSIGTRYPRGGSVQWIGPSPAAVVLDNAFFGEEALAGIVGAVVVTGPGPAITAAGTVAGGGIEGAVTVTGPAPAITITGGSTVVGASTVVGPAPAITITAIASSGVVASVLVEAPMPFIDAQGVSEGEPVNVYFGGGINADREWFEEEARKEAARRAAEAREQARQADAREDRPAPRTDALLSIAPTPAPFVRRGPSPRAVFAALTANFRALAERQALERAEAERLAAIAFAAEQERLAIEAAIRQRALDDEAAEALMALLMHA